MDDSLLNLARAWRSKNFDEIIGQELVVRLVKNSLYKQQFFPVYLLAGQRGCGKTTLARVFAAAINCEQREAFAQQPHEVNIPCLECFSCRAMRDGSHPDYYEIDAASHTGVDNVRGIIEAASFLPVLGRKKMYLIDEAHMLSKAAFNAFLKILEEPPHSVVFMLATTDPHKILDTVRSRCFQLFLDPVDPYVLRDHLVHICAKENIAYEEEALLSIAYESEGSVRDALNHLERLRLGYGSITYDAARKILGDISYELLFDLCESAFSEAPDALIQTLQKITIKQGAHGRLWKKITEILRGFIDAYAGIIPPVLKVYEERLRAGARMLSLEQLIGVLELWYQAEPLFVKSQAPHVLMEMLMLQVNQKIVGKPQPGVSFEHTLNEKKEAKLEEVKKEPIKKNSDQPSGPWADFLGHLGAQNDPLVLSIFKQGRFIEYAAGQVRVQFGQNLVFFRELLEQTKTVWRPFLSTFFGQDAALSAEFTDKDSPVAHEKKSGALSAPSQSTSAPTNPAQSSMVRAHNPQATVIQGSRPLDCKDQDQWKKVNTLLSVFPGTVTEERGS